MTQQSDVGRGTIPPAHAGVIPAAHAGSIPAAPSDAASTPTAVWTPTAISEGGRTGELSAYPGVFVSFEGGDGAGKTTQIELARSFVHGLGRTVVVTREPGGTQVGRHIRELVLHAPQALVPRAEALLFAADRAQHVATLVRPALARGEVVITDRYLDSSVAYQGAGRALDAAQVRDLSLWATQGLLPDLTVLLDVTPEVGRARRSDVHDKVESEPDDFHARVREHFLDLARAQPQRYLVLDAGLPRDQLADAVRKRLAPLLEVVADQAGAP